jgi:mRNA interferase HigB
LSSFVRNRVEYRLQVAVKAHLDAWFAEVGKAEWKNSAELKQQYRSASVVSAGRVVFYIKGNEYRLVVSINFEYQVLFIKWLGTLREYGQINVEKVEYDEGRYADSPDSDSAGLPYRSGKN